MEQPKTPDKPINIVIIDDEDIIRLGLKLALQKSGGFNVVGEASDGETGVKKVIELEPEVVLLDIGMPRMDGIKAAKEIKSKSPNTRIVMLTSHENGEDVFAAFSAGADAYCLKETSSKQLIYAISNIIDGVAWLDPRVAACALKASTADIAKPSSRLLPLEFEVLSLIVEGYTVEQIVAELKISRQTIIKMMPEITSKLAISEPGINAERRF